MNIVSIVATTADHLESFHAVLDFVAREKRYLTLMEAPPLAATRDFALDMLSKRNPHVVAMVDQRVVGWCDISRAYFPSQAHIGRLGIGLLPEFRGQGVGRRLMTAALDQARDRDFIRIELAVHADNDRAIALYESLGFVLEGRQRRTVRIDGHFKDSFGMALMLDGQ